MLFEYDLLETNLRDTNLIECFSTLSREAFNAESMSALLRQKQITNRFAVADLLLSEAVLQSLRREMRRISPGLKVETDFLQALLAKEVIKRELIESEEASSARSVIKRLQRSQRRRTNDGRQTERQPNADPREENVPSAGTHPNVASETQPDPFHSKRAD
jgi:hypothetical protein